MYFQKSWMCYTICNFQLHRMATILVEEYFEVKLTFEMLTVHGQQHSFSTHEYMLLWKCQSFWEKMSRPEGDCTGWLQFQYKNTYMYMTGFYFLWSYDSSELLHEYVHRFHIKKPSKKILILCYNDFSVFRCMNNCHFSSVPESFKSKVTTALLTPFT